MKEIILATRNPSKAKQIKGIFGDSSIAVIALSETDIEGEAYEPEGSTFRYNAFLKAQYVHDRLPKHWVMADDSGICIGELGGAPGVDSAYWAGRDATQAEITAYTLERMEPFDDRSATFVTFVAVISPDGEEFEFIGTVEGILLREERGTAQPGMPYSAIFVPEGQEKTWAQMTTEEENAISHRGKAFRGSGADSSKRISCVARKRMQHTGLRRRRSPFLILYAGCTAPNAMAASMKSSRAPASTASGLWDSWPVTWSFTILYGCMT